MFSDNGTVYQYWRRQSWWQINPISKIISKHKLWEKALWLASKALLFWSHFMDASKCLKVCSLRSNSQSIIGKLKSNCDNNNSRRQEKRPGFAIKTELNIKKSNAHVSQNRFYTQHTRSIHEATKKMLPCKRGRISCQIYAVIFPQKGLDRFSIESKCDM